MKRRVALWVAGTDSENRKNNIRITLQIESRIIMLFLVFSSLQIMFSKTFFHRIFNSLPKRQILRLVQNESTCRLQNKCKEKQKFSLGWVTRVENIVGKGENAGYQHFLLFPQCFQKASCSGSLKVGNGRVKSQDFMVQL